MGQIVFNGQKPKSCNLIAITTGSKKDSILPFGEIWLVDTTNSSKTNGNGKYDKYIIGDGSHTASYLATNTLMNIDNAQQIEIDSAPTSGSVNAVSSGGVYQAIQDIDVSSQISGKEDKSNKVTFFSSPTDTQYPSAKLVSDQLATKQDVINDLADIRANAGKGATAIQSVTVGTTTIGAAGTSASVTNTGTATEPVLSFTIPQGAQGIQGVAGPPGVTSVVITVDNNTGAPYATVSLTNGVLTINFHNIKGQQGDAGSSVAYPFTLVNNVVTDDATQALTAAMGKLLADLIGMLEARTFGGEIHESSYVPHMTIANTNKYAGIAATTDAGAGFFVITPGVSYKIVPQNGLSVIAAILKDIDNVKNEETPHFSDSYTERFIIAPDEEFEFVCPNDAHYVYMLDHRESQKYGVGKLLAPDGAMDEMGKRVDALEDSMESEVLPVSTYVYQLTITSENVYKKTAAEAGARFFPVIPGGKYRVTPQGEKSAIIAILKNIDVLTYDTSPAFSDNYTERIVLASTDEMEFICPDDAHYLYMFDYPGSQLYALAKLTPSLCEQSIELLGMLDGKLNDTSDISIKLDYGTVTGNKTSRGNLFDANGRPAMEAEAASFHQYNSSNFIEAKEYIEILDNSVPVGIIVMYDKDFNYVAQAKIEKQNILPSNVRFVKFCVANVGAVKSVTWSQGSVDTSGSETNRIRSNSVPLSDVGTVMFTKEMRLFLRYYDSNNTLIGNSLAQISVMNTRGMIEKAFAATVTGKTIADVSYMKFMAGETDNADLTTDSAPAVYLPGNPYVGSITIRTFGGRVVKDRNTYNTTFRLVYDTPVNHLANDVSTTRCYSTLMLRLPKNYTQDGKPTRLIIFKSGSRSFDEIFEAEFIYVDYIKYWVDQGYAVMDYFGGTSKYSGDDSFGCATNIASANAAYNYLMRNFNLDNGGVYLSCKSLGGYTTHELMFNGTIPIKAAALLAPAIDNKRYCFGYYGFQRLDFAADMGFTGDLSILEGSDSVPRTDITIQYSDAFKTLLTNNIDKVYGYLPMFNGVINKTLAELLDLHTEIADTWNDVKRIHRVPTQYWVAPDDEDTPYAIAANYVKSCQNTFSPVYLRTMPENSGGHHSTDTDPDAPKVSSITTRLGVTYTDFPLAFVEALNFLERY